MVIIDRNPYKIITNTKIHEESLIKLFWIMRLYIHISKGCYKKSKILNLKINNTTNINIAP